MGSKRMTAGNAFATDGSLLLAGRGIARFDGVGQVVAFERNDDGLFEQVGTIEPPNAHEGADFGLVDNRIPVALDEVRGPIRNAYPSRMRHSTGLTQCISPSSAA